MVALVAREPWWGNLRGKDEVPRFFEAIADGKIVFFRGSEDSEQTARAFA